MVNYGWRLPRCPSPPSGSPACGDWGGEGGRDSDAEPELSEGQAASEFRALAARVNFLVSDRPDIAFAIKELCRGMPSPTSRDSDALKYLARYLLGRPRLVMHVGWQDAPSAFEVHTDSDWAGCVRTRKSTNGGVALRGTLVLKAWCSTQATVALSSVETELTSLARGAAEGLGSRSLAADFGHESSMG